MTRRAEITIAVGDIVSSEELHQRLMVALEFPDFYGRNWDAFWDSITGLVAMPHILQLEGWGKLVDQLPRDAKLMKDCLEHMQRQFPDLAAMVEYK